MANSGLQQSRWYFTKEQLDNSPSRKCGIDADKELSNRQQAANLIQDMGQRLNVTQLCINTAIVYMHRFYVFHSFTKFHRNQIAPCALFLAAKVEEQPRKLEHVIKVAHRCLSRESTTLDPQSDLYKQQAQRLVKNENIMLQTLGFEIGISHPHTFVVKCCTLVKASRDLAQTSYFMATNSLHLTTMCLKYRPTVVACACIHLACKWSSWEIPKSKEGKDWFLYVDEKVTLEELEQLTAEFLAILDKCPSRLRRKIMTGGIATGPSSADSPSSSTPAGPSSTPIATFSSPVMTSPKEEKHSVPGSLFIPSVTHHGSQQQHLPSATITSSQASTMVKDEFEVKHDVIQELAPNFAPVLQYQPPSISQESKPSPPHATQVKVERKDPIPSSVSVTHSHSYHHNTSEIVPPLPQTNSHGSPFPPIPKMKIQTKPINESSFGHRERSDSHGSSKNHTLNHSVDNNPPKNNPLKFKLKVGEKGDSYQVFKHDGRTDSEKDDGRRKDEERRKRKLEEMDRSSRRESRDDKRSKERKHHR